VVAAPALQLRVAAEVRVVPEVCGKRAAERPAALAEAQEQARASPGAALAEEALQL
jgi:hypothetical protein